MNPDQVVTSTRINVQRWQPHRWDQCIGNPTLKRFLKDEASEIRGLIDRGESLAAYRRPNVMVSGPYRSGKTSFINQFMKTLTCDAVDGQLNPCGGICEPCRERVAMLGQTGLYTQVRSLGLDGRTCVDVREVDCGLLSYGQLKSVIDAIPFETNDLMVVLFDEAHRLAAKQADEMLLKVAEQRSCMILLATVAPGKLDPMVRARFTHLRTQQPTRREMLQFLAERCAEWGIDADADALVRLAEKSEGVPGIALNALSLASDTRRCLSVDFVDNEWVGPDDI